MRDSEKRLLAGGFLPGATKVAKGTPTDIVDARTYQHPALGDRKVVRLSPEKLAPGEDLEMEFLGFAAPSVVRKVAKRRRQPLGFPGWPLIHDPDRAKFALEVVKELERELRRAKSKPGHAYEALVAIGRRLDRSVPHFLPSFFEEVARGFVEAGSPTFAGRAFGKAREAERTHALKVDEQHRRDAFLELTLAGALTGKVLEDYARDLAQTHDAAAAYGHFRELCIKRTLGGMPPWANMGKELARLAKAADRDPEQEERVLLEEILESPSLGRAPAGFWKAYGKSVRKLASESPRVRGLLLNLFPSIALEDWLRTLEGFGALEGLTDPEATHDGRQRREAGPSGSVAAWFNRANKSVATDWRQSEAPDALFSLLRAAAPRIREQSDRLDFVAGRWREDLDLDLLEEALSLDLPVVDPPAQMRIDLATWARQESPERRRDPVHVLRDGRYAPALLDALDDVHGTESFETAAQDGQGWRQVRRQWLDGWLQRFSTGGLPDFIEVLERLTAGTTAWHFAQYPEAYARLKSAHVMSALKATLQAGIFDELGWPAFEALIDELEPSDKAPVKLAGAFPFLIVYTATKAIVLSADGERLLDHDLRVPKAYAVQNLRYARGQLFVHLRHRTNWESSAYWSSQPRDRFEPSYNFRQGCDGFAVVWNDGHVEGAKVFRPGDKNLDSREEFHYDGASFWRVEYRQGLRELDPKTGKLGRKSMPRFYEDFLVDGAELELDACHLFSVSEAAHDSPLGVANGLAGLRARKRTTDAGWVARFEGIDGRVYETAPDESGRHGTLMVRDLIRFPGSDQVLPVSGDVHWDGDFKHEIHSADGRATMSFVSNMDRTFTFGSPVAVHRHFWHVFRPRDLEASKKLRRIDEDTLAPWLEVATEEIGEASAVDAAALTKTKRAIVDALGVRDPRLTESLAAVVCWAAILQRTANELTEARAPDKAQPDGRRWGVPDSRFSNALDWFNSGNTYYRSASEGSALARAQAVSRFFQTGEQAPLPAASVDFRTFLGRMSGLAFRTLTPGTQDQEREGLLELVAGWAQTVFSDPEANLRTFTITGDRRKFPFKPFPSDDDDDDDGEDEYFALGEQDHSRYYGAIGDPDYYSNRITLSYIEWAENGKFQPPAKAKIADVQRVSEPASAEQLMRLAELGRDRGPLPVTPEVIDALMNRGRMSRAEAGLLLTGCRNLNAWESNFTSKELRQRMGVKTKELTAAREVLQRIGSRQLAWILGCAIPDDVERLWTPLDDAPGDPGVVSRLAEAYISVVGERETVPDTLIAELEATLPGVGAIDMTAAIFAPDQSPRMTNVNPIDLKNVEDYPLMGNRYYRGEATFFDDVFLMSAAQYVPYLFEALPVGTPIRSALPAFVDAVLERLKDPSVVLPLARHYSTEDGAVASSLELVGGKAIKQKDKDYQVRDSDKMIALGTSYGSTSVAFRPAHIEGYKDRDVARVLKGLDGPDPAFKAARFVSSKAMKDLLARIKKTPVSEGGYEADPRQSVPKLVAKVEAEHGLSNDAATLYLQLLALARPTTKRLLTVNDWKAAQLKKAGAELVGAELVLEAKRARAGRTLFLPGGWEALKSPHPPIETWKLPLYDIQRNPDGALIHPLRHIVPLIPLHQLFDRAYARVEAGDAPAYEAVS